LLGGVRGHQEVVRLQFFLGEDVVVLLHEVMEGVAFMGGTVM